MLSTTASPSGRSRFFGFVRSLALGGVVTGVVGNYVYGHYVDRVRVPNVVNVSLHDAEVALYNAGFPEAEEYIDGGVRNVVADQLPRAGERVPRGLTVKLFLQRGRESDAVSAIPQGPVVKTFTIPVDAKIAVRLSQALHVDRSAGLTQLEGRLAEPVRAGAEIVAPEGARVILEAIPSHESFPSVALALRECTQVDGRAMNLTTERIVRSSGVGPGELFGVVLMGTFLSMFVGFALWVIGLFFLVFVTPEIVVLPVTVLGFVFSGLVALAMFAGATVTVPADTVLHFSVTSEQMIQVIQGL